MPRRLSRSALAATRRKYPRKKSLRELLGAMKENGEPDWERRLAAAVELTDLILVGQQELLRQYRQPYRVGTGRGGENALSATADHLISPPATDDAQGDLAARPGAPAQRIQGRRRRGIRSANTRRVRKRRGRAHRRSHTQFAAAWA